jgi:hypothetical protein
MASYADRVRAADESRRAAEQRARDRDADYWRAEVLTNEERAEYDRLFAAVEDFPARLQHKAALPGYMLLGLVLAITAALLASLIADSRPVPGDNAAIWVLIVLAVVGWVPGTLVAGNRVRAARLAHQATAMSRADDFLTTIDYPKRLEAAQDRARDLRQAERDYESARWARSRRRADGWNHS